MRLSEINIYPIKSLSGIGLEESVIEDRGLVNDRRWMLIDDNRKFITQREFPRMATIKVSVSDVSVTASAGADSLAIPFAPETGETLNVKIWSSTVKAKIYNGEINAWFSEKLGTNCRLAMMPEESRRKVNPFYAVRRFEDTVSFADGYPFLLIGQASLDDLNSRLAEPLPMNRFRPNFVIEGSEPFAEDTWKKIRIGETVFHIVKPCARCVITTVDQETGEKGKEPLKTLAAYRNRRGKVLFGQNLIADAAGSRIRVGDTVEIIEPLS